MLSNLLSYILLVPINLQAIHMVHRADWQQLSVMSLRQKRSDRTQKLNVLIVILRLAVEHHSKAIKKTGFVIYSRYITLALQVSHKRILTNNVVRVRVSPYLSLYCIL